MYMLLAALQVTALEGAQATHWNITVARTDSAGCDSLDQEALDWPGFGICRSISALSSSYMLVPNCTSGSFFDVHYYSNTETCGGPVSEVSVSQTDPCTRVDLAGTFQKLVVHVFTNFQPSVGCDYMRTLELRQEHHVGSKCQGLSDVELFPPEPFPTIDSLCSPYSQCDDTGCCFTDVTDESRCPFQGIRNYVTFKDGVVHSHRQYFSDAGCLSPSELPYRSYFSVAGGGSCYVPPGTSDSTIARDYESFRSAVSELEGWSILGTTFVADSTFTEKTGIHLSPLSRTEDLSGHEGRTAMKLEAFIANTTTGPACGTSSKEPIGRLASGGCMTGLFPGSSFRLKVNTRCNSTSPLFEILLYTTNQVCGGSEAITVPFEFETICMVLQEDIRSSTSLIVRFSNNLEQEDTCNYARTLGLSVETHDGPGCQQLASTASFPLSDPTCQPFYSCDATGCCFSANSSCAFQGVRNFVTCTRDGVAHSHVQYFSDDNCSVPVSGQATYTTAPPVDQCNAAPGNTFVTTRDEGSFCESSAALQGKSVLGTTFVSNRDFEDRTGISLSGPPVDDRAPEEETTELSVELFAADACQDSTLGVALARLPIGVCTTHDNDTGSFLLQPYVSGCPDPRDPIFMVNRYEDSRCSGLSSVRQAVLFGKCTSGPFMSIRVSTTFSRERVCKYLETFALRVSEHKGYGCRNPAAHPLSLRYGPIPSPPRLSSCTSYSACFEDSCCVSDVPCPHNSVRNFATCRDRVIHVFLKSFSDRRCTKQAGEPTYFTVSDTCGDIPGSNRSVMASSGIGAFCSAAADLKRESILGLSFVSNKVFEEETGITLYGTPAPQVHELPLDSDTGTDVVQGAAATIGVIDVASGGAAVRVGLIRYLIDCPRGIPPRLDFPMHPLSFSITGSSYKQHIGALIGNLCIVCFFFLCVCAFAWWLSRGSLSGKPFLHIASAAHLGLVVTVCILLYPGTLFAGLLVLIFDSSGHADSLAVLVLMITIVGVWLHYVNVLMKLYETNIRIEEVEEEGKEENEKEKEEQKKDKQQDEKEMTVKEEGSIERKEGQEDNVALTTDGPPAMSFKPGPVPSWMHPILAKFVFGMRDWVAPRGGGWAESRLRWWYGVNSGIFRRFQPKAVWFGLVDLLHMTFLTLLIVWSPNTFKSCLARGVLILGLTVIVLLLVAFIRPYRQPMELFFTSLVLIVELLLLISSVVALIIAEIDDSRVTDTWAFDVASTIRKVLAIVICVKAVANGAVTLYLHKNSQSSSQHDQDDGAEELERKEKLKNASEEDDKAACNDVVKGESVGAEPCDNDVALQMNHKPY